MGITERIDHITKVTQDFWKATLPAPKSVKIELTSRCNFSCGFCSHRKNLKKYGDMDFNFYKRVVKEMYEAGVQEIGVLSDIFFELVAAIQNCPHGFLFKWLAGSNPEIGLAIAGLKGNPSFLLLMLIAIEPVGFLINWGGVAASLHHSHSMVHYWRITVQYGPKATAN